MAIKKFFWLISLLGVACSQQECNGETICDPDVMDSEFPDSPWFSSIEMGTPDPMDGDESYPVTWTRDPFFPPEQRIYSVVVRELNNPRETVRILPPTRNSDRFVIRQLTSNVEYEVMVCYSNVTRRDLPPVGEFSSECGLCRTCFMPQPDGTSESPTINRDDSTMQMFPRDSPIKAIFRCEAEGEPTPNIRWIATNSRTDQEVEVTADTPRVTLETTRESDEVTSTLTIMRRADITMPICIAENPDNPDIFDELRANEFVRRPPRMTQEPPTENSVTLPAYAVILVIVVPVLVIAALVFGFAMACIHRRRYIKKMSRKLRNMENRKGSIEASVLTAPDIPAETSFTKKQTTRKLSLMDKLPDSLILPPEMIQVSTIIGQGEFGVVYKGYLKSDMMDTVAIKTLKGIFATATDIQNASAEILKMKEFDHPNVMPLIGVCVGPADSAASGPCIVMPFMAKGSLLDHLRKETDSLFVESEKDINIFQVRKSLVQMCLQIASGMEYLSNLKFIHRDLAARNCLMDAHGGIRVSDFGLAEDIYSQNYFRQVEGGVKLPLKWMALESIKLGVFTEKTDVWSYGVTCWEIFSGGAIPYPGVHPHSVLTFLEDGDRLSRPKNAACCKDMYALMLSFWERKDEDRPNFSSIVNTLSSYLEVTSDYLDLTLSKDQGSIKKPVDIEDSPEHRLQHVPSNPNDYYVAESM